LRWQITETLKSQQPKPHQMAVQELEAGLETGSGNTVKLFTIHKAKGLEFPLVILADMGGRQNNPFLGKFNFRSVMGLGCKVLLPERNEFIGDYEYTINKEEEKRWRLAEDKRLLYVALTRAKDYLILSGSLRPSKSLLETPFRNIDRWIALISKYLDITSVDENKTAFFEEDFLQLQMNPVLNAQIADIQKGRQYFFKERFAENLKRLESLEESPGFDSAREGRFQLFLQNTKELKPEIIEDKNVTVSQVITFMDCPKKHHFRYKFRIPKFLGKKLNREIEEKTGISDTATSDATIGDVFHKIVRRANLASLDQDRLLRSLQGYSKELTKDQIHSIESCIVGICSKNFQEALELKAVKSYKQEIPFLIKVGRFSLRGQIDLLLVYEDSILVLDYKTTSKVKESDREGGLPDHFRNQMLIYGLACSTLFQQKAVKVCLYFPAKDIFFRESLQVHDLKAFRGKLESILPAMGEPYQWSKERPQSCSFCEFRAFCELSSSLF